MGLQQAQELISQLSYEDLLKISDFVEEKILESIEPDTVSHFYNCIRDSLVQKFGTETVDNMPPWTSLKPGRKQLFKTRWMTKYRLFKKWGLDSEVIGPLMTKLITLNLKYPAIAELCSEVTNIEVAFDLAYPGYKSNKNVMSLLNTALKGQL